MHVGNCGKQLEDRTSEPSANREQITGHIFTSSHVATSEAPPLNLNAEKVQLNHSALWDGGVPKPPVPPEEPYQGSSSGRNG